MELLVDVGHVNSHFGLFGDIVGVDAIYLQALRRTYHRLGKSFWTHLMELLGDVSHLESRFFPFGDSVSVGSR